MRNERWVNRFLFAWNDSLFYDPLETDYVPRDDHFLAELDKESRRKFVRAGLWWSHRHNPHLPAQGWKIHVSASQRDVRWVAAAVIEYLTERHVDFKIALDLNIYEMLNSKGMSRGSAGKLVTIYPQDDDEFRQCLVDLAKVLDGAAGAYILSDHRYKESKALYFRYGQFLNTHTVDVMGRELPHILSPDGTLVPDSRRPVFSMPDWVPWPFPDWERPPVEQGSELLAGRFRVVEAVRFSNSGGIYKAQDTADDDRIVIVKEARPSTNVNPREDHDAVDLLRREWEFLTRLADVGLFPHPVALFQEWEHHFIAEELIDGTDIREILFEHNPLVRLTFDASHSTAFLRIFLQVFAGLATAVRAAHERNVVLGDLTAANLLVHPETFEVRVLDLEACRLVESNQADAHLQRPVDLYTPGFSRSRGTGRRSVQADDLYGLATTMAYFVFPIAAMSYLRDDVFSLYRQYLDDLGWPVDIYELIVGLAEGATSLETALLVVSDPEPLVERVRVRPREVPDEEQLQLPAVEAQLAAFVAESADVERPTLFPCDPFAHVTNPLSLGFGAGGVLYALNASGLPVRPEWVQWLRGKIAAIEVKEHSAGLMNGLAGLAWAANGLGLDECSGDLLAAANELADETSDHTFYYGLAGVGMTNLYFYTQQQDARHLAAAERFAKELCGQAQHDGDTAYWLNDFSGNSPLTGLGFGQAGPALFLLRMYQATEYEPYLTLGEKALRWELAHAEQWQGDSITFRSEGTLEPYVEVGGAGIAQVLLRYRHLEAARKVLNGLRLSYTVLPGYVFGFSGIIDAMLDAATVLNDDSYRRTALKQFNYIRRVFFFEPPQRTGEPTDDRPAVLAVPGEGLLRCTCDFGTGSAGVLRVVRRLQAGGTSDFLLDQLGL